MIWQARFEITSTIVFIYKLQLVVYIIQEWFKNEMFSIESTKYQTSCIDVLQTRASSIFILCSGEDQSHVGMVPIKLLNPKLMNFNGTGHQVEVKAAAWDISSPPKRKSYINYEGLVLLVLGFTLCNVPFMFPENIYMHVQSPETTQLLLGRVALSTPWD